MPETQFCKAGKGAFRFSGSSQTKNRILVQIRRITIIKEKFNSVYITRSKSLHRLTILCLTKSDRPAPAHKLTLPKTSFRRHYTVPSKLHQKLPTNLPFETFFVLDWVLNGVQRDQAENTEDAMTGRSLRRRTQLSFQTHAAELRQRQEELTPSPNITNCFQSNSSPVTEAVKRHDGDDLKHNYRTFHKTGGFT